MCILTFIFIWKEKYLVFDRVKKNHSLHPAWIFGILGSETNFCKESISSNFGTDKWNLVAVCLGARIQADW